MPLGYKLFPSEVPLPFVTLLYYKPEQVHQSFCHSLQILAAALNNSVRLKILTYISAKWIMSRSCNFWYFGIAARFEVSCCLIFNS